MYVILMSSVGNQNRSYDYENINKSRREDTVVCHQHVMNKKPQ